MTFLPVHGLWIIRGDEIIGESQVGSPSANVHHRQFVQVFTEQVILPSKATNCNNHETAESEDSPSYTVYVKKRQFLFHILTSKHDHDLIVVSMTKNTVHQSPVDAVFDLLNAISSAMNTERKDSLSNILGDLHHEYQLRARPKVSLNFEDNPLFLSDEEIPEIEMTKDHDPSNGAQIDFNEFARFFSDTDDDEDDSDINLEFCNGYDIGSEPSHDSGDSIRDQSHRLSLIYGRELTPGLSGHNATGTGLTQWTSSLNLPSPSVTRTIGYSSDYYQIFHAQPSSSLQPTPSNSPQGGRGSGCGSRMDSGSGSRLIIPRLSGSSIKTLDMSATETLSDSVGLFDVMDRMEQKERELILMEDEEIECRVSDDDHNDDGKFGSKFTGCLPVFVLKSGWMTKVGSRFKTRKYRYFELWSNGLLNYFDDEMKRRKRGSLNVMDEVTECALYSVSVHHGNKTDSKKSGEKEHGFKLTTHDKKWRFLLNHKRSRDQWLFLFRTMAISNIDIHQTIESVNRTLQRVENKWHSEMKNLQFDIHSAHRDEVNIYRLRTDVKSTINILVATQKEYEHFQGSDVHSGYQHRMDRNLKNLRGALSTIETVVRLRNEGPYKSWQKGRALTLSPLSKHQRIVSCGSEGVDGNVVLMSGQVHVRLPSKSVLATKSALSKTVRVLQVEIRPQWLSIERMKDGVPPLVWKFEEIERLNDIKGVYYGAKTKGAIHLNDIQQYDITIEHMSGRRAQFLFYEQQEAFSWFTTLTQLHDQCHLGLLKSPQLSLCPEPKCIPSRDTMCDEEKHLQIGL